MKQLIVNSTMIKFTTITLLIITPVVVTAQQSDKLATTITQRTDTKPVETITIAKSNTKLTGYIQTQFQYGQPQANLNVGTPNYDTAAPFSRIGIRRGRLTVTHVKNLTKGVVQIDFTEKGIALKDAYIKISDKWLQTNSFKAGIFTSPFGYEKDYSSSLRESPERSSVFRTLFPDVRDIGLMIALQPGKTSPLNFITLEAAIVGGNGVKHDNDNKRDFTSHLSIDKNIGNSIQLGLGLSGLYGYVYQGTQNIYTMQGKMFVLNSDINNQGKFANRKYFGIDAQVHITTALGTTKLHSEYITGTQPGEKTSSKSPNLSKLPTNDTYIRQFAGGYVMLVHDIRHIPLSAVVKYDWYDPNTSVKSNDIGIYGTDIGDLGINTVGMGLLWRTTENFKIHIYTELIKNETSSNIAAYRDDLSDNLFTLRLQYRF